MNVRLRFLGVAAMSVAAWRCASAPPAPKSDSTASSSAEIASPAGPGSAQPAFDGGREAPILSWTEAATDGTVAFRFAIWRDGAFAAPQTIAADAAILRDSADAPGVRRLTDGSLLAYWSVKLASAPYAHDLVAAVSRDQGNTWSNPIRPHTDRSPVEHGFASLVPDPSGGGATMFWLDGRDATDAAGAGAATGLFAAHWDGAAFGPERRIDPRVCDCCRTAAIAVPGATLVAYRDRSDHELRDISTMTVTGAEVSQPRPVHDDGWTINACPTNGPAIVDGGSGTLVLAWFTAAGNKPAVRATLSKDLGATFAAPIAIDAGAPVGRADAAAMPDGSAVVWLERAGTGAEVRARLVKTNGTLGPSIVAARCSAVKGTGVPRAVRAPDGRLLIAWTDPLPAPRVRIAAVDLPL